MARKRETPAEKRRRELEAELAELDNDDDEHDDDDGRRDVNEYEVRLEREGRPAVTLRGRAARDYITERKLLEDEEAEADDDDDELEQDGAPARRRTLGERWAS